MSQSKVRADEIAQRKAQAAQDQQQRQTMAYMMSEEAVYVNGFYLAMSGRMIRVAMIESSVPEAPSQVRGSFVIHAEDFEKLIAGGGQLLAAIKDGTINAQPAGPVPVAAVGESANDEPELQLENEEG